MTKRNLFLEGQGDTSLRLLMPWLTPSPGANAEGNPPLCPPGAAGPFRGDGVVA